MTREELRAAGCDVSADGYKRLVALVAALREENTRLNLTSARALADVWRVHILDSLAVLPALGEPAPGAAGPAVGVAAPPDGAAGPPALRRVVDIGCGGGLPGLPLACLRPDIRFTLIDATRRKVEAVRRMVRRLALPNVDVVWGRAEALAASPSHRERYDVALARAVAGLRVLVGYVAGFLRVGGEAWFHKTLATADAEVAAAAEVAGRFGLELAGRRPYRWYADRPAELVLIGFRKVAEGERPRTEPIGTG